MMKAMRADAVLFGVVISTALAVGGAVAAETHVISTKPIAWTYKDGASTPAQPVVVADLHKGDIIDIKIGTGKHGFVTIKKGPDGDPVEARELVLACGEDASSKSAAVLKELDCGPKSKFGVELVDEMRMEVLETFKDDVSFWCVIHLDAMTGVLKLKN